MACCQSFPPKVWCIDLDLRGAVFAHEMDFLHQKNSMHCDWAEAFLSAICHQKSGIVTALAIYTLECIQIIIFDDLYSDEICLFIMQLFYSVPQRKKFHGTFKLLCNPFKPPKRELKHSRKKPRINRTKNLKVRISNICFRMLQNTLKAFLNLSET